MQIRLRLNDAIAEVDDELGKKLIESGGWDAVTDSPRKRRTTKPVEEPSTEE